MDGIATQAGMIAGSGGGTTFPAPTHYWDLDTTGFVDSAGGWTLTQNDGTVTIDATGGPDGGLAAHLNPVGEELIRVGGEYWDGVQDNLTVSIWAKIDNFSSTGNWLFSWRGAAPNDQLIQVFVYSSGGIRAAIFNTSGTFYPADSTTTATTGNWYHITATHDGSNLKIYVNGVLEDTTPTPAFDYSNQLMPLALGAGSWTLGNNGLAHDGMLAKCGVWDVALTGSEINTLYNSGNGLNYADL